MGKQSKVNTVDINEGEKISLEQNGYKLIFGDDELAVRVDKYQKDEPVHLDICVDKNQNLVIGVGVGRYYVAQVDIPEIQYQDIETVQGEETITSHEAIPLDMGEVTVTLWSMDDLTKSA
jgi:hypothetical protein